MSRGIATPCLDVCVNELREEEARQHRDRRDRDEDVALGDFGEAGEERDPSALR